MALNNLLVWTLSYWGLHSLLPYIQGFLCTTYLNEGSISASKHESGVEYWLDPAIKAPNTIPDLEVPGLLHIATPNKIVKFLIRSHHLPQPNPGGSTVVRMVAARQRPAEALSVTL